MKVLITLLFVFSTASLSADASKIRPSWSGAWFNPDQPGHGISVEVLDDERTVFFWYTYDLDGKPFWLIAEGVNSDVLLTGLFIPFVRVEATAYYYEGMIYGEFDPATKSQQEWGTIILDFPYWRCNEAHMEWQPVMEGFSQGSTDLVRLTTLYGLDCVDSQDIAGNWEVQFGFDAELKFQVEIVAMPNPEIPELPNLFFEFSDESDCLWSGQLHYGFGPMTADWGNQCGTTAVEHTGTGERRYEYRLCDSENDCRWTDEVMIFEDEGAFLIFSR
jgi:hypothetical protein